MLSADRIVERIVFVSDTGETADSGTEQFKLPAAVFVRGDGSQLAEAVVRCSHEFRFRLRAVEC